MQLLAFQIKGWRLRQIDTTVCTTQKPHHILIGELYNPIIQMFLEYILAVSSYVASLICMIKIPR